MSAPDALPEGWATATLGEVAVLQRGVTFPASASRGEPGEGTVPCLRTANVQKQLQWDDLLHIPAGYVSSERRWLREGDTVISMANSNERVGKVALAKGVPPGVTFGAFLSVIRSSLLDPEYLFHLLSSPAIQLAIHGTASRTVNIANLSIKGLRSVPLPIASLQEQRRIVAPK